MTSRQKLPFLHLPLPRLSPPPYSLASLSPLLPYLAILALGFLVYGHTLSFGLTDLDDTILVKNNFPLLKYQTNILRVFQNDAFLSLQTSYYRPLLTLSFIGDTKFMKDTPNLFVFHLSNLFIHLASASLLYLLLLRFNLSRLQSLFFSLLFVVHPVLAQAVVWIPGRNDSLLTLFILLSLLELIEYFNSPKTYRLIFSLIAFALALLTKETAVIFPLLALLYLLLFSKPKLFSAQTLFTCLGWALVIAGWLLLRHLLLPPHSPTISLSQIVQSVYFHSPAVLIYIGKLLFPIYLSVTPIREDSPLIFGELSLILLIIALILSPRKRLPYIIFGICWFLLFLLPSFVAPQPDSYFTFYNHRLYLPIFGLFLILSQISLFKFTFFTRKSTLITPLILIIFSLVNLYHTSAFKDSFTFWQNAILTSPHSPASHAGMGMAYATSHHDLETAEKELKISLELNPNLHIARNNLGVLFLEKKEFQKAEQEFLTRIKLKPKDPQGYYNLGTVYYNQNDFKQAIQQWEIALQLNPNFLPAYYMLIPVHAKQGDLAKSNYYLEILRQKDPAFLKRITPEAAQ